MYNAKDLGIQYLMKDTSQQFISNWPWARLTLGRLRSLGASFPSRWLSLLFRPRKSASFLPRQLLTVTNSRMKRLFTDTDMFNPELRKEMEDFYLLLQRILARRLARLRVDIPSNNYDLTLDITPTNDGRIRWSYYYACLETRCLFWLHPYDTSNMISKLVGEVRSPAHISASQTSSPICCLFTNRMPEHRLEALYWYVAFLV
jgi:hypothetical protein